MTTEGEQQEAVCGTCDGDGTLGSYQGEPLVCSRCKGTGRIPAPVVPSDDECQACNGEGGGYVSVGANEWDAQACDVCRGTGRRFAPPTSSLEEAREEVVYANNCGCSDCEQGMREALARFEAAVRAEVIREVEALRRDEIAWIPDAVGREAMAANRGWNNAVDAILRALSLGGEGEA